MGWQIDERLKKVEEGVQSHSGLQEALNTHLEAVQARLSSMDTRFDAVEVRFEAVDAQFEGMDIRFDGMDARLDAMHSLVNERLMKLSGAVDLLVEFLRPRIAEER